MKSLKNDFGAVGGGAATSAVDTAAWTAASLAIDAGLSELRIDDGMYCIAGGAVQRRPCVLYGTPRALMTVPAGDTAHALTWRRDPLTSELLGWGISGISVEAPIGDALRLDLSALPVASGGFSGAVFDHPRLSGGSSGRGFRLVNPACQDGFFCSEFHGGAISGGAQLDRCGDSVSFTGGVILTGLNSGIEATFVPGAAKFLIDGGNFTAQGGSASAVNLTGALQPDITHCTFEHVVNSGAAAVIILTNCFDGEIRNNNINTHGNCGIGVVVQAYLTGSGRNIVRANSISGVTHASFGRATAGSPSSMGDSFTSDNRCYDVAGALVNPVLGIDGAAAMKFLY